MCSRKRLKMLLVCCNPKRISLKRHSYDIYDSSVMQALAECVFNAETSARIMSLAFLEKAFFDLFCVISRYFKQLSSSVDANAFFAGSLPFHESNLRQDAVTKLKESLSSLTSEDDHDHAHEHAHEQGDDHEHMSDYNDTLPVVLSVVALV